MLSSSQSLLSLGLFFSHWQLFQVPDPLLEAALNSPVCLAGSKFQLLSNLVQSSTDKAYLSRAFITAGDTRRAPDLCIKKKEGQDV